MLLGGLAPLKPDGRDLLGIGCLSEAGSLDTILCGLASAQGAVDVSIGRHRQARQSIDVPRPRRKGSETGRQDVAQLRSKRLGDSHLTGEVALVAQGSKLRLQRLNVDCRRQKRQVPAQAVERGRRLLKGITRRFLLQVQARALFEQIAHLGQVGAAGQAGLRRRGRLGRPADFQLQLLNVHETSASVRPQRRQRRPFNLDSAPGLAQGFDPVTRG